MRAGRQKPQLTISDMERAQLSVIARSRSMPAALVLRAKIVLACECEANNQAVAANLNLSPYTVGKWRSRFVADRLQGLYDEVRSGRPRTVKDEAVVTLISKTLASKPEQQPIGACAPWLTRPDFPRGPCIDCFSSSRCSRVGPAASRFPPIPSSSRSCAALSACISIDRTGTRFLRRMKRAKSRRWNAPDRCCPSGSAILRVSPMMTNPTAPPPCAALNRLDGSVLAQCKPRHRDG